MRQTEWVADLDTALARIDERVGPRIVAATALGLGKPNRLLNALYARVAADPARQLTLITALSLLRPEPGSFLERRFLEPFLARHFGADYPDLAYAVDRRAGRLPPNVRVHEFYFQSGALLGNAPAQRDYASINYTHVAREAAARGVNLMLQLVARRGDRLSLSCNPDVSLDLLDRLAAEGRPRPYLVFVVHPELPFLGHDAEIAPELADLVLEEPGAAHRLFAIPAGPVSDPEYALGLHASTLVRDGGTLQIGIGALSDALVHGLLLRERENATWHGLVRELAGGTLPSVVTEIGGTGRFARGLYGASEMVMDGFMHLRRAGILRRRVFDDVALQTLMNRGAVGEIADADTLARLIEAGVIAAPLDRPGLDWLMRFGLLDAGAQLADGVIHLADGSRLDADLLDADARRALAARIAGRPLRGGRFLHGAFFLGGRGLYDWLRQLDETDFEGLCMTRVSHINELYGGAEALHRAQRHAARFFNTCMMQTLLGAAVSDALADGQVVSGVGGQYNFVAMAHALADGRSALMLRATREVRGELQSNLVWNYGHTTIPRHLRDLVVTEYGVADLRGATDEECVQRLLAIADARFLEPLAAGARAAGKLAPDWRVPEAWRGNTPERLARVLEPAKARGLFPRFPFGTELDDEELALAGALRRLQAATATPLGKLRTVAAALFAPAPDAALRGRLARLGLDAPRDRAERLYARLVTWALRRA